MDRRLFLKGVGAVALVAPVGVPTLEAIEAPVMALAHPKFSIGPPIRAIVQAISYDAEQGRVTLSIAGQWAQYVLSVDPKRCSWLQPGDVLEVYNDGSTTEAD